MRYGLFCLWMLVPLVVAVSCGGAPDGTVIDGDSSRESPFTPEVEEFVRNFRPGGQDWAEKAEPLPAEEALKRFRLAEGLEIDLVAHEPLVQKPLNLHFDERGRLWVVLHQCGRRSRGSVGSQSSLPALLP